MSSENVNVLDLPGYTCPVPAWKLALKLEDANCRLTVRRNGSVPTLIISGVNGQRPRLGDETRADIARWKIHLIALADWIAAQSDHDVAGS